MSEETILAAITALDAKLDKRIGEVMARIDRLQEQMTATMENGFVNFAIADRARKNTEGIDDMLASFQRRLLRLESRVANLEGDAA